MTYKVGSQPPDGYIQWHEWAAAQDEGGLVQSQCPVCYLWFFPQEKGKHEKCTPTDIEQETK